jgi:hypothetical protein
MPEHQFVPALLAAHPAALQVLLYLAPSLLLALVLRRLSRRHPFFFLFTLAGTVCHELAHFCVGFVTCARPVSFSVVPRRVAGKGVQGWQLGAVRLANLRWFNAAPVALAPFLVLAVPLLLAGWRTAGGWHFEWRDLAFAFLLAPQFLACWPSSADWKLAWRSGPFILCSLALGTLVWWCTRHFQMP